MKVTINMDHRLLTAGLVREIQFESKAAFDKYIGKIKGGYYIAREDYLKDGRIHVVLVTSYNNSDLFMSL